MPTAPVSRRRADVLMAAIHTAVLAELAEHGYADLTFEGVARRAATSKPVLYRRYRTRAHMALDAWSTGDPLRLDAPSSGSMRDDLASALTAIHDRFQRAGVTAFRGIIAEADDDLLKKITDDTEELVLSALRAIEDAGRARGEVGPSPLPRRTVLLPLVLLRHELFFTRGPLDAERIAQLVDQVTLPAWLGASSSGGHVAVGRGEQHAPA
jgi:AcrR family transcriptional regulator